MDRSSKKQINIYTFSRSTVVSFQIWKFCEKCLQNSSKWEWEWERVNINVIGGFQSILLSLCLSVSLSLSVSLIKLGKFIRGKQMFPSRNSDELKHLFKLNSSSTKLMSKRAWAPTVTHSQELTLASENPCPLSWEARHIPSFASPVSFYFLAWMVKIYLTLFFTSWYFIVYI